MVLHFYVKFGAEMSYGKADRCRKQTDTKQTPVKALPPWLQSASVI